MTTERGKKINFPQTSQIPNEETRTYCRKLTRVLEDLLARLQTEINYTYEQGVTDHGDLTGLDDINDHLYAFLHDGSRAFTDYGPGFTNDTSLSENDPLKAVSEYAIKAYIDALLAYILASPLGSIIYIWEDLEGNKKLEKLIPGYYGQVLVTGGSNQRPFWDWVWEAPGGEGSPSIVFYLIVERSYKVEKITPDYLIAESAAIGSDCGSNQGPNADWYEDYDRSIDSDIATDKISLDHTSDHDLTGDLTLVVWLNPLRVSVSDSITITDDATVSVT